MKKIEKVRGKWKLLASLQPAEAKLSRHDINLIIEGIKRGEVTGDIIYFEEVPETHFEIEEYLNALFTVDPWVEDPRFPLEDWKYEVDNDDTRQSYRGWLYNQYSNLE